MDPDIHKVHHLHVRAFQFAGPRHDSDRDLDLLVTEDVEHVRAQRLVPQRQRPFPERARLRGSAEPSCCGRVAHLAPSCRDELEHFFAVPEQLLLPPNDVFRLLPLVDDVLPV